MCQPNVQVSQLGNGIPVAYCTNRLRLTQQMYVCTELHELVIGVHTVALGFAGEDRFIVEGKLMRSKMMGWVGSSGERGQWVSVSGREVSGQQQGRGLRTLMEDNVGMGTARIGTWGQCGSRLNLSPEQIDNKDDGQGAAGGGQHAEDFNEHKDSLHWSSKFTYKSALKKNRIFIDFYMAGSR